MDEPLLSGPVSYKIKESCRITKLLRKYLPNSLVFIIFVPFRGRISSEPWTIGSYLRLKAAGVTQAALPFGGWPPNGFGDHVIFLFKLSAIKGFPNILCLWHDRITIKLYFRPWKTTLYLCYQLRQQSLVRYKDFSYGKQSLEVRCFYSGPFFFLGLSSLLNAAPPTPHIL